MLNVLTWRAFYWTLTVTSFCKWPISTSHYFPFFLWPKGDNDRFLIINSEMKAVFSIKHTSTLEEYLSVWGFLWIRSTPAPAFLSRGSPSWLPASLGIVCAWAPHPGSWCCRKWSEHGQQSVGGEATLKEDVLPAGGRLGAADIPSPAGPGGGGPAASARPPCPRCKQSLTEQQGAHGEGVWRVLKCSQLLSQKERLTCLVIDYKQTNVSCYLFNKQGL